MATAQPWTDMSSNSWKNARFFEYRNTGSGATVNGNRPQLSDAQAANYTPQKYLAGTDGWNPVRLRRPPHTDDPAHVRENGTHMRGTHRNKRKTLGLGALLTALLLAVGGVLVGWSGLARGGGDAARGR